MAFSFMNGVELLSGAAGAAFLYLSSREMYDASSELLELTIDPVFFGIDVPAGDGHPVMVLPGLFATDQYLRPLRGWLRRIGYTPLTSGLKRDIGKLKVHTAQVLDQLAAEARGTKATLIGHSFGGVIARAVARDHPELVRQIITLGSPLRVDAAPLSRGIPLTAFYSRQDRIVRHPRGLAPPGYQSIEVGGSHCGLAYNVRVYRHLGGLLHLGQSLNEQRREADRA